MAERTWICQRVEDGAKCGHTNPKRRHICERCGKKRPPTKKLAHKHCLEVFPYKTWVMFFGETCNICGRVPDEGKKLMRDHDHRVKLGDPTAGMRGLLCFRCNHQLPAHADLKWTGLAYQYLQRYGA